MENHLEALQQLVNTFKYNIESYKRFSDGIQQRISSNKDYSFKKLDRDDDGKVDYILDLNGFKITQHHFLLLFINKRLIFNYRIITPRQFLLPPRLPGFYFPPIIGLCFIVP